MAPKKEVITMAFQDRLYSLRKGRGISQEELANVIGVSRQAVQKWEAGSSTPDIQNLSALTDYFGVSLDYLVRGIEPQTETQPAVVHNYYGWGYRYEFCSKTSLFGLPLVHINLGPGFQRAKGIIAIGNFAAGVVAVGGLSAGLFSVGAGSLGLLALGGMAVGGVALGGLAVGLLAAVGGFALSLGLAMGGGAVSRYIALGGAAFGQYASGGMASGSVLAIGDPAYSSQGLALTWSQVEALGDGALAYLQAQLPHTPRWLLRLLLAANA